MKKFFTFIFIISLIIGGLVLLQAFILPQNDNVTFDENRQLDSFSKISVAGNFEVHVRQGNQSVQIIADQSVLQEIETEVENNELKIGWNKHAGDNMKNRGNIIVNISIPELEGVSIAGSGIIKGVGKFTMNDLNASVAGSGEISIEIICNTISSEIAGSGNILIIGTSNKSDISIAGSGKYEAANLETKETNISISGSGKAEVNVSEILNIDIAGSGHVSYYGSPKIEKSIAGSGNVRKQTF